MREWIEKLLGVKRPSKMVDPESIAKAMRIGMTLGLQHTDEQSKKLERKIKK